MALTALYALAVRPRLLRWGATNEEVCTPFPGADMIAGAERSATMAVTIDAPPEAVWPWLVQMGYRRAGWYSWDALDNFGAHSAEQLHPEWQTIAIGDLLAGPEATAQEQAWEVAMLDPGRFLGLRASVRLNGRRFEPDGSHPKSYSDSLWCFLLKRNPDESTRLVVSGYWSMRPRWLQPLIAVGFLDWAHWIMQLRQFRNLKRRCAGLHSAAVS